MHTWPLFLGGDFFLQGFLHVNPMLYDSFMLLIYASLLLSYGDDIIYLLML